MAAARLRGEPLRSSLGLWPGFSFANHACTPSATVLMVGDRLMIRAVTDMAALQEVCTLRPSPCAAGTRHVYITAYRAPTDTHMHVPAPPHLWWVVDR